MASLKPEIVTFKADASILDRMKGIPNRSEFIRAAILRALENTCPLCGGTGVLTPHQRAHWEEFERDHTLEMCDDCHEVRLVCGRRRSRSAVHGRLRR